MEAKWSSSPLWTAHSSERWDGPCWRLDGGRYTDSEVLTGAAFTLAFARSSQPFGSVCELIPAAESVIKLNAVCTVCGHDAGFTRRIVADKSVEVRCWEASYRLVSIAVRLLLLRLAPH